MMGDTRLRELQQKRVQHDGLANAWFSAEAHQLAPPCRGLVEGGAESRELFLASDDVSVSFRPAAAFSRTADRNVGMYVPLAISITTGSYLLSRSTSRGAREAPHLRPDDRIGLRIEGIASFEHARAEEVLLEIAAATFERLVNGESQQVAKPVRGPEHVAAQDFLEMRANDRRQRDWTGSGRLVWAST
jgi:hypothetical protein